jgi:hypothetical protein
MNEPIFNRTILRWSANIIMPLILLGVAVVVTIQAVNCVFEVIALTRYTF